jgi:hypothetical protein
LPFGRLLDSFRLASLLSPEVAVTTLRTHRPNAREAPFEYIVTLASSRVYSRQRTHRSRDHEYRTERMTGTMYGGAEGMTEAERTRESTAERVFGEFVDFRFMIASGLMQVLFWLGVVFCVIGGAAWLYHAWRDGSPAEWVLGFGTLLLGPVVFRIGTEFIILFFRMNETLTEMRNLLQRRP